jgi:DNA-binding protein HU-beta
VIGIISASVAHCRVAGITYHVGYFGVICRRSRNTVGLAERRGFAAEGVPAQDVAPYHPKNTAGPLNYDVRQGFSLRSRSGGGMAPASYRLYAKGTTPMNQQELVSQVAEATGLTKAAADKAVEATLAAIAKALAEGGEARIQGFGTFSVTAREARQGRNPRSGEAITIAASKAAKFAPAQALKDALNG